MDISSEKRDRIRHTSRSEAKGVPRKTFGVMILAGGIAKVQDLLYRSAVAAALGTLHVSEGAKGLNSSNRETGLLDERKKITNYQVPHALVPASPRRVRRDPDSPFGDPSSASSRRMRREQSRNICEKASWTDTELGE